MCQLTKPCSTHMPQIRSLKWPLLSIIYPLIAVYTLSCHADLLGLTLAVQRLNWVLRKLNAGLLVETFVSSSVLLPSDFICSIILWSMTFVVPCSHGLLFLICLCHCPCFELSQVPTGHLYLKENMENTGSCWILKSELGCLKMAKPVCVLCFKPVFVISPSYSKRWEELYLL